MAKQEAKTTGDEFEDFDQSPEDAALDAELTAKIESAEADAEGDEDFYSAPPEDSEITSDAIDAKEAQMVAEERQRQRQRRRPKAEPEPEAEDADETEADADAEVEAKSKEAEDPVPDLAEEIGKIYDPAKYGNMPAPEAFDRLLKLNQFANENPVDYLDFVIKSSKIDAASTLKALAEKAGVSLAPAEEAEEADDDDDDLFADPETKEMRAELEAMRAELAALKETDQSAQAAAAQAAWDNFVSETDASGKRLRPHMEAVQDSVRSLMAAEYEMNGRQPIPPDRVHALYEQAAWGNPETRSKLLAEQAAAQTPGQGVDGKKPKLAADAEKAKRASAMIDGVRQGAARNDADLDSELHRILAG